MSEKDLILPAFAQNNIPVCFSCDANFVPYLGVCISSIVHSSSIKNNYDILILEDKIPEWNKQRVLSLVKDKPNFSIRFVNVTPFFEQASSKRFYIRDRYTLSTYARFFIPDIFQALFCKVLLPFQVCVLYRLCPPDVHNTFRCICSPVFRTSPKKQILTAETTAQICL